MSALSCPHCGTIQDAIGSFCGSCGKAMPAESTGPRIVQGSEFASTGAGQQVQAIELKKKARSAAGALLAVAILQTIGAGIITALVLNIDPAERNELAMPIAIGLFIVAGLFFGLFFWARKNPLPAAIVGLVLYGTLLLVDAMADPTAMGRGLIIKVIIVVVLLKAISAGVTHRQLLKQMG